MIREHRFCPLVFLEGSVVVRQLVVPPLRTLCKISIHMARLSFLRVRTCGLETLRFTR